jgi:hypothetical protein
MDVMTAALVGQLIALVGLTVLVVFGPPRPRRMVRIREDGRTEQVDENGGEMLWRLLTRLMVGMFACSTFLGITSLARV